MYLIFVITGVLIGIAIRTCSPLSLNLAEPMWKLLCGMKLMPTDLIEIDKDYVPGNLIFIIFIFIIFILILMLIHFYKTPYRIAVCPRLRRRRRIYKS